MRILIICRQFLPVRNGTELQAAALARELMRQGHAVRVLAGRSDPSWPEKEVIDGVETVRLPSPHRRLIGTWLYTQALGRYLRNNAADFDVVHVMFAKHAAATAARLNNEISRPVVCKPACVGPFGDLAAVRRSRMPRHLLSGLMRLDRMIAISSDIAEEWIGAGFPPSRIVRIPNGVDAERFRPPRPEERSAARTRLGLPREWLILSAVGRLVPQKGFENLIRAAARVDSPSPIHLIIAGEGELAESLRAVAEECGIGQRVRLPGRVEPVETVYHAADLFVLSSLAEGMPNVLLEAMACGLAPVSTRVSGAAELIEDGRNGLLAEPGSVDSLEAAINRWLALPAGALGAEARRTIEARYALSAVAKRLVALYEEVIGERKLRGAK